MNGKFSQISFAKYFVWFFDWIRADCNGDLVSIVFILLWSTVRAHFLVEFFFFFLLFAFIFARLFVSIAYYCYY